MTRFNLIGLSLLTPVLVWSHVLAGHLTTNDLSVLALPKVLKRHLFFWTPVGKNLEMLRHQEARLENEWEARIKAGGCCGCRTRGSGWRRAASCKLSPARLSTSAALNSPHKGQLILEQILALDKLWRFGNSRSHLTPASSHMECWKRDAICGAPACRDHGIS